MLLILDANAVVTNPELQGGAWRGIKDAIAEAAAYAQNLGKPINRVYVSHSHPDHFFGAAAFGAPVYALPHTLETIAANGPQQLASNHAAVGDLVPRELAIPTELVTPGEEVIDGVRFEFREVRSTETESLLVASIPDAGVIFPQDLVYNNLHLFIAEGHLEEWAEQVEALRGEGFTTIMPGHGAPGGPELYNFVLDYLRVAGPALASATGPEELNAALTEAFPNAGGVGLLHVQNRYIFPAA